MPASSLHSEETRRLAALHALNILDSEREERFDRLTRLAQRIFKTQTAQVNLIDQERVWFKSSLGFPGEEVARSTSFCGHAILGQEATVVGDATSDEPFADNPFVLGDPNIRFYAGHPITAPGGEPIGPSASSTTFPATSPSSTPRRCGRWRRWPKPRSPRSRWRSATS